MKSTKAPNQTKLLEIFREGKQTASNGMTLDFSESDLKACVEAYDPSVHEAPLVVGHPKAEDPAYGWVKSLDFQDGILKAEPKQVNPEFAEIVDKGSYKKISSSFYLPDSPANPKPGVLYLRHVGFLGAQAPSIKGLKTASFGEQEEGVVEFSDWGEQDVSMWRKLREWIISQFGLEAADQAVPAYDINYKDVLSNTKETQEFPNFSEPSPGKELPVDPTKEDLERRQAELAREKADLAEEKRKIRHGKIADFAEGLVKEGRILPKHQNLIVNFMSALPEEGVLEFEEAGVKTQQPLESAFKSFLKELPKVVEFKEVATGDDTTSGSVEFSAPPGYTVDAETLELHQKAIAYQNTHSGVDYVNAIRAVGGH
jgi:hypothetical protein